MDRLIVNKLGNLLVKESEGQYKSPCFGCDNINSCSIENGETCGLYKVVEKLYQYEQLEDQGLLLRKPCNVGSHVWVNGVLGCGEAEEYKVIRVDYHNTLGTKRNEFYIEALLVSNPEGNSIGFYDKEIGKSVFLSKEEAENHLVS